ALLVAFELELGVDPERVGAGEGVGDHGVVEHQLRRDQRVDGGRVSAELRHGVAHGHQVHHAGDTGEVLHEDACGRELDLGVVLGGGVPVPDRLDVRGGHYPTVFAAQEVLEEDLQRIGE